MTVKKAIGKIHLFLGLASGLVVFMVSITGCLYVFEKEIRVLTEPWQFSKPSVEPPLAPGQLKAFVGEYLEKKHRLQASEILGATYYRPGKSAVVPYYNADKEYTQVYVNPQTGEILADKVLSKNFFRIVLMGHYYLWLPPAVGKPVVASATLIFVVMLISGLILWWPKNKKARRQRLWFRWKSITNWRRKNYDLHNILGFYVFVLALLVALTGLVWGFQWFAQSVYWATSGGKSLPERSTPISDTTAVRSVLAQSPEDILWEKMYLGEPAKYASFNISFPKSNVDAIRVITNTEDGTYYRRYFQFFDRYSLKPLQGGGIPGLAFEKSAFADKLHRMNYDIHVGAILGLPGKILAFLASLTCASLPVTGFMVWWGRRKKSKKTSRPKSSGRTRIAATYSEERKREEVAV